MANAQENKDTYFKDAISYALENKADAKKAKLKVENSEYQIQEVRAGALPKISANGSLT
jgi:outer membrane protein TolC